MTENRLSQRQMFAERVKDEWERGRHTGRLLDEPPTRLDTGRCDRDSRTHAQSLLGQVGGMLIVRAVNSHQELLNACHSALTYMTALSGDPVNWPLAAHSIEAVISRAEGHR